VEEILCYHGCGRKAIKQNGLKHWICSDTSNGCPVIKKKNSDKLKEKYALGWSPNKVLNENKSEKEIAEIRKKQRWWEYKSEEEVKAIRKKYGETYKLRINNGEIIPSFTGKRHTENTKRKMSELSKPSNNGLVKTKWFKVYCPYVNENINVQGTWELAYANYLNKNSIPWLKDRIICKIKYMLDDIKERTYYPDFYLPNTNEFIENDDLPF
jgi:hypothetical protein